MSSSSCYDDSPTEASEDGHTEEIKKHNSDDDKTVVITQTKVIARRFESWHEKFLSYKEILDYLVKLGELYQHKCIIERLGYSKEQRPICLVKICSNRHRRPQMSVLIEAGCNGMEKMTVSSVLFLIDYLVKNDFKFMVEYLIIPCLNPDGYEKCLKKKRLPKKDQADVDLTKCFPIRSETPSFMANMLDPSPDTPPNCSLLAKVVEQNRINVKLFISLQASESSITYPLDHYFKEVYDFAVACKKSMGWDSLDVKPIVPALTQDKGTSVEHIIRNYNQTVKFAYLVNVHNKSFVPEEKFILTKGEQTLCGIQTLTKRVYRYYYKQRSRYNVQTVVKLLDSTE
ncbi:uncharacterized protein LOC123316844 [Coccinella septempunctata]|uniref:uncharacterized protein LOC123316844 n=1 Tax=Coccinella septempunctata TaxID=41139 RepID=UPI001D0907B4|nr:uncharacterized protein LOC123316844 [Coccinella septempunctata]